MSRSERSVVLPPGYPDEYECDVLGLSGAVFHVRPIRPNDAKGLIEFHDRLSGESVHRRFFSAHPHLRPEEVTRFTCVDYQHRLALVAEVDGDLVAVGRYDQLAGTDRAEVAFVVADALQGQGLGTLLLEHLAAAGRRQGIATFFAETLAYNHPMVRLFHRSGFPCTSQMSQGVIDLSFSIAPSQQYLDAVTDRHLAAVRAWMGPQPLVSALGRVAIIGHELGGLSAVARACDTDPIAISRSLIAAVGARPSVCDLLAYLVADDHTQVVLLDLTEVTQPRRFVATARAVAQRKPTLLVLAAPSGDSSSLVELCHQGGVEIVTEVAALTPRLRELLAAVEANTWKPIDPGALPSATAPSSRAGAPSTQDDPFVSRLP